MTTGGGTRTLLFTDLVRSTERMEEIGEEEAQRLYLMHRRLLRRVLAEYGGQEVKNLGDGLMAAFASALDAVGGAVAAQQAVYRLNQASPEAQRLSVRIGLHSGEPVTHEGDYFGLPVVIAQRLCSAAEGGQVIVSEVVRALAGGRSGRTFRALGPLTLKGISEPVTAFEAVWEPGADEARSPTQAPAAALPRPAGLAIGEETPFVGRQHELSVLEAAWSRVRSGQCLLALVAGEPGIGKTRLTARFCASSVRGPVLYGRCDEEMLVPYQPVAEALRHYVRFTPTATLRTQIGPLAAPLLKLLPELAERLPELATTSTTPAPSDEPEGERYLLFEAVRAALSEICAASPAVLVLDDLHWADKATLLLLRYIMRSQEPPRLLLLGTYRDTDVRSGHPLTELIADLRRDGRLEVVRVDGLDETHVADLVGVWMGDAAPRDLTHAVYANSGGNPFFVVEIMNHIAEAGLVAAAGALPVQQIGIPQSVREAIVRRLGRLSPTCNRVLSVGAVLGHEFELDVLQQVAGLDDAALLDAVEEGLAAGLLAQPEQSIGTCNFTHALIREALYSELTAARRAHLHRQVGEALEQRYLAGRERYLAPLAYHLAQAADSSNASRAARYASLAAQRASEQLAHEEAVRFYELALRVLRLMDEPDEPARCELLLAIGRAQAQAGNGPAAGESFQTAAALARKQQRPDLLGEAALGFGGVRLIAGFVDEPLIALLRAALDALGPEDSPLRARLVARLTAALYHSVTHQELMALSAQAVDVARRLNDPPTLVFVLLTVHLYRFRQRDLVGRLAGSAELIALAEATGDKEAALRAHRARVIDLLEAGDAEALDSEMRAYEERAYELRQPLYIHLAVIGQAMRALLDGRFEEAERLARKALELGQDTSSETAIASLAFAVQLFGVRKEQGRLGELEGVVRQLVDQYPALPSWQVALAHIYSETGNVAAARGEFDRLAQGGFAGLPEDFNRPIALALLAETCASLGDATGAAQLYDLLLPLEGRCAVAAGMSACIGSASRHLGLLAATMRRWEDAERHLADALEMNRRLRSPPLVAHTQHEWAAMLLARGDAADRPRAQELLREAGATARAFSMERLAATNAELLDSTS